MRRRALLRGFALAALCTVPTRSSRALATQRVQITVRKFELVPREIRALLGQPLTLVLQSTDFVHGFSLPDFDLRRDLVPGLTTEVTFVPDRAGRFNYLCDNFCGEGHDRMSGVLIVWEEV